jgi:hypothetical protein
VNRRPVAVGLAVAVALAGCGGTKPRPRPTPTPTPNPPTDEQLLQRALDARASAVRAPGLGVHGVALKLDGARVRGDRARVRVRLTYRVLGVPGSFGASRRLNARRGADGRWRIGGPVGTRDRAPWEADRYRRLATGHFVVWFPRGVDLDGLPVALDDGYVRMRTALRAGTLRKRYLVVVARDARHGRRITSSIRGLRGLTALTDTQVRQSGPAERVVSVASQRVLVLLPAFASLDPEQQRQTVAHELTHATLAPVTSGRVPSWLIEGTAMYVSGDRRPAAPSPTLRALSAPDEIGRLDGAAQADAYGVASAAAFAIADRYGPRRLLALYEVFNGERLRGKAGDPALVDRAVRQVLGVSLRTLQRRLRP